MSTLQKNDPSLLGHQVHPGGPRPPGLRTGINMSGKTMSGLKSGKMKQHRLRSQDVDPGTRKLGAQFRTPSRKLSTSSRGPSLGEELEDPSKCWNVSDRLDERKLRDIVRWHFHKLLRRLRLHENRARTAG